MAFNGSGVFARLFNWVVDRNASVPITASRMDSEMDGLATGLSNAICRDGQSTTTAVIPFAARIRAAGGTIALPTLSGITDTDTGVALDVSANTVHIVASASAVVVVTPGLTLIDTPTYSRPKTASFLAYASAGTTSVTGNGLYGLTWDGETYDVGSTFASNAYVANVTGKHILWGIITLSNLNSTNTNATADVVTTLRTYHVFTGNVAAMRDASSNRLTIPFFLIADMTINDNATVQVNIGGGQPNVGILGNSFTLFGGCALL